MRVHTFQFRYVMDQNWYLALPHHIPRKLAATFISATTSFRNKMQIEEHPFQTASRDIFAHAHESLNGWDYFTLINMADQNTDFTCQKNTAEMKFV